MYYKSAWNVGTIPNSLGFESTVRARTSNCNRRNRMDTTSIIFLVIIAVIVIYVVSIFNRLVALKNRFKNAFAQIEVQLKRRYDLIPNLVETAKGYIKHERETLEAVIQARNAAANGLSRAHSDPGNADAIRSLSQAEGNLAGAMGPSFSMASASARIP